MTVRIIIVVQHAEFRHLLMQFVRHLGRGYEVIGATSQVEEALACIDALEPDLALVDAELAEGDRPGHHGRGATPPACHRGDRARLPPRTPSTGRAALARARPTTSARLTWSRPCRPLSAPRSAGRLTQAPTRARNAVEARVATVDGTLPGKAHDRPRPTVFFLLRPPVPAATRAAAGCLHPGAARSRRCRRAGPPARASRRGRVPARRADAGHASGSVRGQHTHTIIVDADE